MDIEWKNFGEYLNIFERATQSEVEYIFKELMKVLEQDKDFLNWLNKHYICYIERGETTMLGMSYKIHIERKKRIISKIKQILNIKELLEYVRSK